jgi:hypothetical protein
MVSACIGQYREYERDYHSIDMCLAHHRTSGAVSGDSGLTHPASAKERHDFVGAEARAWKQSHVGGTERIIPMECLPLPQ